MLNRAALIVRPLKPYIDWAVALDDSGVAPRPDDECTIYLVSEYGFEHETGKLLAQVYAEVFERELFAWHTDEAAWPKKRTRAAFKRWFKVEFHSVVEDLARTPIVDDEDEEDEEESA